MRRLTLIALVVGLAGCVTPSIPIPPPDPARMTFNVTLVDNMSFADFTYPSYANYHGGIVYLYDRTLGQGIIRNVNSDDSIGPARMRADVGDEVVVTVQTDDQTASTCVKLRNGTGQDANSCSF